MSTHYKFWDSHATYFVTFAVVDWIDVFTRNDYREIVADSIKYCIDQKGLIVHGWVLMTNHVHLLISLQTETDTSFSDIMRHMKKYTAMQLIKNISENPRESRKDWMMAIFEKEGKRNANNTNFQFWRQDNHPLHIQNPNHYSKTLAYIHNNPVNSGFVEDAAAYPWSSARDYDGKAGLIPIAMI